jgi:RNA polymerase sigma-70 factor (ECF subfamily)
MGGVAGGSFEGQHVCGSRFAGQAAPGSWCQPAAAAMPGTDIARQTQLVKAFLAASRNGDFAALLAALDPDVVLRADPTAVQAGALAEVRGASAVARQFAERAVATLPALVAETPGTVWAITLGTPCAAFSFTTRHGKIVQIDMVFNPRQLRQLDLVIPDS